MFLSGKKKCKQFIFPSGLSTPELHQSWHFPKINSQLQHHCDQTDPQTTSYWLILICTHISKPSSPSGRAPMALSQTTPISLTHLLDYGRAKQAHTNGDVSCDCRATNLPKGQRMQTAACFFSPHLTSKQKRVLTEWRFHTRTDLCVYIDHVVFFFPVKHVSLKSLFFLPHHKV